jgi:hypothetical protein
VPAGEENYNVRFFFHTLGDEADNDPEVHVTDLEREDMPWLSISPDGRYLTAGVHKGWERSDLFVRDLRQPDSGFVPVAVGFDAHFSGTVVDDLLYIHTDLEAPATASSASPPGIRSEMGGRRSLPNRPMRCWNPSRWWAGVSSLAICTAPRPPSVSSSQMGHTATTWRCRRWEPSPP